MIQGDLFQRTLALLQRAALEDGYWLSAAAGFNEATGTRGHGLGFGPGYPDRDGHPLALRFVFGRRRREDWERVYTRDYMTRDERLPSFGRLASGEVAPTGELLTGSERKTSAVYNELLRDMRGQDGLNVRLDGPAGTHIVVALADSIETAGWSSGQVEMIERLLPHMGHSIGVRQLWSMPAHMARHSPACSTTPELAPSSWIGGGGSWRRTTWLARSCSKATR